MDDLIDAAEVARILHVTERHVTERLAHKRAFPRAYRPGNKRLWPREEIRAWLESTRERVTPAERRSRPPSG